MVDYTKNEYGIWWDAPANDLTCEEIYQAFEARRKAEAANKGNTTGWVDIAVYDAMKARAEAAENRLELAYAETKRIIVERDEARAEAERLRNGTKEYLEIDCCTCKSCRDRRTSLVNLLNPPTPKPNHLEKARRQWEIDTLANLAQAPTRYTGTSETVATARSMEPDLIDPKTTRFHVGDKVYSVKWRSDNHPLQTIGTVVAVVPAGQQALEHAVKYEKAHGLAKRNRMFWAYQSLDHESYLVAVGKKLYHPQVKDLRRA